MADDRATLLRIWLKPAHGIPMRAVERARAVAGKGLEGDVQFAARRAVTLIEAGRWARAERDLGGQVDPALRKANLLVSGVELAGSRGRLLRIGPVLLRVRGETTPCAFMDEQHAGLQQALRAEWGGGAHAEVVEGGELAPGDPVAWEAPPG